MRNGYTLFLPLAMLPDMWFWASATLTLPVICTSDGRSPKRRLSLQMAVKDRVLAGNALENFETRKRAEAEELTRRTGASAPTPPLSPPPPMLGRAAAAAKKAPAAGAGGGEATVASEAPFPFPLALMRSASDGLA